MLHWLLSDLVTQERMEAPSKPHPSVKLLYVTRRVRHPETGQKEAAAEDVDILHHLNAHPEHFVFAVQVSWPKNDSSRSRHTLRIRVRIRKGVEPCCSPGWLGPRTKRLFCGLGADP